MQFRRQKRQQDGINLTPLIDVVFLLLIFFMVSTTFTRETRLEVNLPEADGYSTSEELDNVIEILIDKEGSYAINGNLLVNRKIDTIISALQQASGSDNSMPIILTADANAPHRSVVTVMDAAGQLGFTKLNIATQEHREQEN